MNLEAGPGREGVGACPQPSAQTRVPPSYLGAVLFLGLSPHSWGLRLLTCGRCCGTQGVFHVLKGTQRWPKANTHPSTAAFKEALATVTDFSVPRLSLTPVPTDKQFSFSLRASVALCLAFRVQRAPGCTTYGRSISFPSITFSINLVPGRYRFSPLACPSSASTRVHFNTFTSSLP